MNSKDITSSLRDFANQLEEAERNRVEHAVQQRHIQSDINRLRIRVSDSPANQDAFSLLLLASDEKGNQWYCNAFNWAPYRGFDLLDVSGVAFTGQVTVKLQDKRASQSRGA